MEEHVMEWYDLHLSDPLKRMKTLSTFGFQDLLNNDDDFKFIIDSLTAPSNSLEISSLQIGGDNFM